MLSAFMGFIEQGDEVIVFEPYFDQYGANCQRCKSKAHSVQ